jgi:hypothetical protein
MTMYPLTHTVRCAAVAVLVFAAGCAPLRVNSYAQRGYDLSRFHTYAWAPQPAWPTGDPRLDSNPFFDQQVRGAIEVQLAMQGFERTASTPELLVHYHADMTQRIEAKDLDLLIGSCERGDCRPEVYDAGTILIDFVDPRTQTLVWRGWAEGSMEGVIDNQALMEAKINQAVTRILEQLPRQL